MKDELPQGKKQAVDMNRQYRKIRIKIGQYLFRAISDVIDLRYNKSLKTCTSLDLVMA